MPWSDNTFNVGVLGSSPRRITGVFGRIRQNTATGSVAVFFLYVQTASECALCDTSVGKSWANNPWAFLPTIENPDTLLSLYWNFRDEFPHSGGVLNLKWVKPKFRCIC